MRSIHFPYHEKYGERYPAFVAGYGEVIQRGWRNPCATTGVADADRAEDRRSDQDPRIARLRAELADEGVPLPTRGRASALFLAELAYARRPRVHERYVPSYGSILLESAEALAANTELPPDSLIPLPDADRTHLRRFCDGRASFLVQQYTGERLLACFRQSLEFESDLVRLQRSTGAYIIQRTTEGTVRVFTGDTLVTWDGVRWVSKPPASKFQASIKQLVPQADPAVLGGILEFCAHWLSPAYVGATLVWYLVEPRSEEPHRVDLSRAECAPQLHLTDRAQYPALLSVLQQVDGAALLSPDGKIMHLQAILRTSDRARQIVPGLRGTRHTSARRFSFDEPRSVVFVVSEDGPVSVFSDGARTALVRTDQSWARPPGSIEQRVKGHATRDISCPGCGKNLIVDLSVADEENRPHCPICDHVVWPGDAGGAVVGIRKISAGEHTALQP